MVLVCRQDGHSRAVGRTDGRISRHFQQVSVEVKEARDAAARSQRFCNCANGWKQQGPGSQPSQNGSPWWKQQLNSLQTNWYISRYNCL